MMRLPAVLFACTLALGAWTANAGSVFGLPDGWTLGGEAPRLYAVDVDKSDGAPGHEIVELRRTETSHAYGGAWLAKRIPVGAYAGKRVHLSMRVRFDIPKPRLGMVYIGYDDGANQQSVSAGAGWTTYGATLTLPAGLRRLDIGVALAGPGSAAVDDIALQVVGDAPSGQSGMLLVTDHDSDNETGRGVDGSGASR